jgi:hypothetical protein
MLYIELVNRASTESEEVGQLMWIDPIVEEIRKIRQEHAAKFNFD